MDTANRSLFRNPGEECDPEQRSGRSRQGQRCNRCGKQKKWTSLSLLGNLAREHLGEVTWNQVLSPVIPGITNADKDREEMMGS